MGKTRLWILLEHNTLEWIRENNNRRKWARVATTFIVCIHRVNCFFFYYTSTAILSVRFIFSSLFSLHKLSSVYLQTECFCWRIVLCNSEVWLPTKTQANGLEMYCICLLCVAFSLSLSLPRLLSSNTYATKTHGLCMWDGWANDRIGAIHTYKMAEAYYV